MLDPKTDRLDYGQLLSPKKDEIFDFAIGTTYSLDLAALTGICMSLGLSQETDSSLLDNPLFTLEAINATCDKMCVLCEAGQISLKQKATSLYTLLQDSIFQISLPKKNKAGYYAFHPKFWLIRYKVLNNNLNNNYSYRLVILSRNITFDRSWDLAVCFESSHESNKKQIQPIQDFLKYLNTFIQEENNDKALKVNELISQLDDISFALNSDIFKYVSFYPTGFDKNHSASNLGLYTNNSDNLLIMSPFISPDIIKHFNSQICKKNENILITRLEEIHKLKAIKDFAFDVYAMDHKIVMGEYYLSEAKKGKNEDSYNETENTLSKQDIHAKLYFIKQGNDINLYIGSHNASTNAFGIRQQDELYSNIEFMVCLSTTTDLLNFDNLKQSIFGEEKECPFKLITNFDLYKEDLQEKDSKELNNDMKLFIRSEHTAQVSYDQETCLYTISLNINIKEHYKNTIQITPLLIHNYKEINSLIEYKDIPVLYLSELFLIKISNTKESIERIIKIKLSGDVPKNQKSTIMANIIQDRKTLFSLISIMLDDNYVKTKYELKDIEHFNQVNAFDKKIIYPALYEKLLKAVANPKKRHIIKQIDNLIVKLTNENDLIDNDFIQFYSIFKSVLNERYE
ncbi:hypothetical protein [Treponema bryantii]|uniref:hypothetical protein n=1 Tax=Treponema bryantii TaxID=163 RepID=UPI0003B789E5|nr:hypothetical protein [Treponema bryantii]